MPRLWKFRWNGQLSTYVQIVKIVLQQFQKLNQSKTSQRKLGPNNFNVEIHQIQGTNNYKLT